MTVPGAGQRRLSLFATGLAVLGLAALPGVAVAGDVLCCNLRTEFCLLVTPDRWAEQCIALLLTDPADERAVIGIDNRTTSGDPALVSNQPSSPPDFERVIGIVSDPVLASAAVAPTSFTPPDAGAPTFGGGLNDAADARVPPGPGQPPVGGGPPAGGAPIGGPPAGDAVVSPTGLTQSLGLRPAPRPTVQRLAPQRLTPVR